MKTLYITFALLTLFGSASAQKNQVQQDTMIAGYAYRSLGAAIDICIVSFIGEAAAAGLILAGMEMKTDEQQILMATGLFLGFGSIGMTTNHAILAQRAYKQIQMLNFTPEQATLKARMIKNVRTARTLTLVQNLAPFVGVAAGVTGYLISKPHSHDDFYESPAFWIPIYSICGIGMLLSIPEIILFKKTRQDLNTYRQQITLGTTRNGIGISIRF